MGLLTAIIILCLSVAIDILTLPKVNYQGSYDCAIVLGAAVDISAPSPVFAARLKHGVELYQQNQVKTLIFTGGLGVGDSLAEGDAGAVYAKNAGISVSDILVDRSSKTTLGNLSEAKKLMDKNGLNTAIIVSDPLHLRRSILAAEWLEMQVGSSATPYSRYRSWKTKMPFLLREIYFMIQFNFLYK
ncbi:MAG: YdcF family protein [Limnothrix sp.]